MTTDSLDIFRFSWPMLKVVLEGLSILDVPRLEVKTMEEATGFIQAYGYDAGNPEDLELIWRYFDEAVGFLERTLADPEHPRVPDHLRSREAVMDLRRLLLLASEPVGQPDQLWACAILRIMHVLIHLAHDPRLRYFESAQNQVLGRLDEHLYVDSADGAIYLGRREDGGGIKLLFFKKKDRKDRDREIVKLLHKAESTVEVIYDRIGFRLVTETKFDVIRAVRLLLTKNIISSPNIRPSRSRNWLIDVERLRHETDRVLNPKKGKPASEVDVAKLIKRLERRIGIRRKARSLLNPHTSEHYRAIQFTCRELVKVRNPMHNVFTLLQRHLENIPGGRQIVAEIFPRPIAPHEYVFFPYEIQIMDVKSYADSIFGKSNHEEYRKKQLQVARNRVFGRSPFRK